jgi:HEAT repeat protein
VLWLAAPAAQAPQWQDVIRNLRSPEIDARLEAVEQLGEAGYTAAAEYVAPLVTDSDDRVQAAAIDAELTFFLIEPIGARRVFSLTGRSRSRAQVAFDAGLLVRVAAPAPLVVIDNLATAMGDENARIRFDAVHALGVVGEAPLPPDQARALIDGLDHYDPVIRAATARVLGRLAVVEAGEALISALNDSSALVRRYAAEALGRIREERAVQSLAELTAFYGQDEMAAATVLALARIAHPSSLDLLRQRLADPNAAMRRAAAEGVGRLGDQESRPALEGMMASDPSAAVRLAAALAIGRLGEPQTHVLASAVGSPATKAQACEYLLEIGPAAVPGVQSALAIANTPRLVADLLHVLGFIGDSETVAIVQPYAEDPNPDVQRAATNAIARITGTTGTTGTMGTTGTTGMRNLLSLANFIR